MTQKKRRIVGSLALLALSMIALIACSGPPQGSVQAIVAFDVSCLAKDRMLGYASIAYRAQRSLPPGSEVRVYVFGHGADLIYTGRQVIGREAFTRKIGRSLNSPPGHLLRSGTQTDRLLEAIASDVRSATRPVCVLVATDGGMEDQSAEALARLGTSVRSLRGCSRLQWLALVGVAPEHRKRWEDWLAPLGRRARVLGDRDAEGFEVAR